MESIPPQVQNQIRVFQQTQDSLRSVSAQRQQFEQQVRELDRTLKALDDVEEGQDVYRSVGSLLVRVKDRNDLVEDLGEQKETMEVRLKALERQETSLKDRLEELQGQIEAALGSGAPAGG